MENTMAQLRPGAARPKLAELWRQRNAAEDSLAALQANGSDAKAIMAARAVLADATLAIAEFKAKREADATTATIPENTITVARNERLAGICDDSNKAACLAGIEAGILSDTKYSLRL